jgi:hypothetical protein
VPETAADAALSAQEEFPAETKLPAQEEPPAKAELPVEEISETDVPEAGDIGKEADE